MHIGYIGLVFTISLPALGVIHGKNDIYPIHTKANPIYQEAATKTLSLIPLKRLGKDENGHFIKGNNLLKDFLPLCSNNQFSRDYAVATCSGVLIAPDIVLTSGHCITQFRCDNSIWTFDYQYKTSFRHIYLKKEQTYRCVGLLGPFFNPQLPFPPEFLANGQEPHDIALVKLDRKAKGVTPVRLSKRDRKDIEEVFSISNYMGTPKKVSEKGSLFNLENARSKGSEFIIKYELFPFQILSDLDIGHISSGSGVFDSKTGELVGINSNLRTIGQKLFEYSGPHDMRCLRDKKIYPIRPSRYLKDAKIYTEIEQLYPENRPTRSYPQSLDTPVSKRTRYSKKLLSRIEKLHYDATALLYDLTHLIPTLEDIQSGKRELIYGRIEQENYDRIAQENHRFVDIPIQETIKQANGLLEAKCLHYQNGKHKKGQYARASVESIKFNIPPTPEEREQGHSYSFEGNSIRYTIANEETYFLYNGHEGLYVEKSFSKKKKKRPKRYLRKYLKSQREPNNGHFESKVAPQTRIASIFYCPDDFSFVENYPTLKNTPVPLSQDISLAQENAN